MKPAVLAQKLAAAVPLMCCPRCQSPFSLTDHSLICAQRHCYDLSSKGYVNLAPSRDQSADKYDAALFQSRAAVFGAGLYTPVAEALAGMLRSRFAARPFTLLDAGCGEGYYARMLADCFPAATVLGIDVSRDAITAAARQPSPVRWLVADLKHLPLRDGAADVVLDVLTPADYAEFRRVLTPGGVLIKVIPGANYLREAREALAKHLRGGGAYDNARVLEHLSRNARVLERREVRMTHALTPELSRALLRMTPMTFSVPDELLDCVTLSEITVEMELIVADFS